MNQDPSAKPVRSLPPSSSGSVKPPAGFEVVAEGQVRIVYQESSPPANEHHPKNFLETLLNDNNRTKDREQLFAVLKRFIVEQRMEANHFKQVTDTTAPPVFELRTKNIRLFGFWGRHSNRQAFVLVYGLWKDAQHIRYPALKSIRKESKRVKSLWDKSTKGSTKSK